MKAFVTYKSKISFFLGKGASISALTSSEKIIVCEVLSEKQAGEQVLEIAVIQRTVLPHQTLTRCSHCFNDCPPNKKLKRCSKCYKVAYCDQNCQTKDWHTRHRTQCKVSMDVIGCPFIISIPESTATYSRITHMMELFSRYSVELFKPPVLSSPLNISDNHGNSSSSGGNSTEGSCSDASSPESESHPLTNGSQTGKDADLQDSDKQTAADSADPADRGSHQSQPAAGDGGAIPVQFVSGKMQDIQGRPLPFFIKPCDKEGRSTGERLEDTGDNPLDLSSNFFLAMDWNNNERSKSYVLVKSKDLEFTDDERNPSLTDDNGNLTLSQCLESFTEPEVLSPEHAWYCPRCKQHREASKQLSIWKLPDTLIIQLKRFSFRNMLWRDKIDKLVDFPVTGLDMGRYFIGNHPVSEPPPIYDLYGVVNHYGGILGGHYTSFGRCSLKDNDKGNEVDWRLFDDSQVSWVGNRSVVSRAAYVLFYRRRKFTISPRDDQSLLKTTPTQTDERMDQKLTTTDERVDGKLTTETVSAEVDAGMTERVDSMTEKSAAAVSALDDDEMLDGEDDRDRGDHDEERDFILKPSFTRAEPLPYTDMDAVD